MKPLLSLLALLLVVSARAGEPRPPAAGPAAPAPGEAAAPAEEPRYYYHSPQTSWWGDVVSRRDISMTSDLGKLDEICLIPPAADWISDGASEEIQKKYLHLLWRVEWSISNAKGGGNFGGRTIGTCGVNAYAMIVGLGDYSNFFVGGFDDSIKKRAGYSSCLHSKYPVKGAPKYASHGKTVSAPGIAVAETLNLLLGSKHPETVLEALSVIRSITSFERFRERVEALVRDKSVTATVTINPPDEGKQTIPLRVYAMGTLATMDRTERTAKLLALIWHDDKEPEEIRVGALRAFAFISEWGGVALKVNENRPVMQKALYPFLAPAMMLFAVENDKKEEAGAKAKLSPLGEAAFCLANTFPKKIQIKARKGKKFDDPD
ncbi:MAG: hypothetical protein HY923_05470 [Elusimicrobia bacterium]|nr:hypothetical protein [Elusimicrobiota bacterium]